MFRSRTSDTNATLARIHRSIVIEDIRSIPGFDKIVGNHPSPQRITGYYAHLPLEDIAVSVPKVHQFKDRFGEHYKGGNLEAPLLTLEQWHKAYQTRREPQPDLLVNANFFYTAGRGSKLHTKGFSIRTAPRTHLYGLSMHHGIAISNAFSHSKHAAPLDAIFFDEKNHTAQVAFHRQIKATFAKSLNHNHLSAVSGYIILNRYQQHVRSKRLTSADKHVARTGIGLLPNRHEAIVIVVENRRRKGGITIEQFTQIFRALGCHSAINLDGGGSSEMFYAGYDIFGEASKVQTKSSDIQNTERPKPNCIGFSVNSRARFFSHDDADITKAMRDEVDCLSKKDALAYIKTLK